MQAAIHIFIGCFYMWKDLAGPHWFSGVGQFSEFSKVLLITPEEPVTACASPFMAIVLLVSRFRTVTTFQWSGLLCFHRQREEKGKRRGTVGESSPPPTRRSIGKKH